MAIKFYLLDNPLTPDPRDCRAQVVSLGTKTLDDVIDVAAKLGTMVTKADLKAVTEILFEEIIKMVEEGWTVHTPICHLRPKIKGVFIDKKASFNASEHEIIPNITPSRTIRERVSQAGVEKLEAGSNEPVILEFLDETSGATNGEITPNGMGVLAGSRLAFDQADAGQGMFFIDASGTETKVSRIAKAKPGEVIFSIPDTLTQGFYRFTVRTRLLSSEIREGEVKRLEVK